MNPTYSLQRMKRQVVGLALLGAVALPLLAATPAHARYDRPVMEGPCPNGASKTIQPDSSLPGYPAYCAQP